MSSLSIRSLIIMCLLLPVAGFLAFAGWALAGSVAALDAAAATARLARTAPAIGTVVHEMQRERGRTAAHLAAGGTWPAAGLDPQRRETDAALERLRTEAAGLAGIDGLPARLAAVRRDVAVPSATADQAVAAYSALIQPLLTGVAAMAARTDGELGRHIAAYVAVMRSKENAGRERAAGAAGFAAGSFPPALHRRLVELAALEEASIQSFREAAGASWADRLDAVLAGAPEVVRLREIALAAGYGGSLAGVTADEWFAAASRRIDGLKGIEDGVAAELLAALDARLSEARLDLGLLAAVVTAALAVTGWLSAVAARGLAGPIGSLTAAMDRLAAGDTGIVVPDTGRGHEIGRMARALESFRLARIAAEGLAAERQAEQAARVRRAESIEQRVAAFEAEVEARLSEVAAAVASLGGTAAVLSETAASSRGHSASVAAACEQAAMSVQSMAGATEQLSSSISEITAQAAHSSEAAQRVVERGRRSAEVATRLSAVAGEIDQVLTLISEVAAKTNLLALNATIEAARAGESGKGFAVVAGEVKGLAAQTAQATGQIAQRIAAMRSSTDEVGRAVREVAEFIDRLSSAAEAIAAAVEQQGAATREIARNAQQAAVGTDEVTRTMTEVSGGARSTGDAAERLNDLAGLISRESDRLQGGIRHFLAEVKAA